MGWQEINISRYIEQLKISLNLKNNDNLLEKDLLLTLILAEFEKMDLGKDLIFKGGTLLSRNYLKYHRFSEDLDFVFKDSNAIRDLGRNPRERKVKIFLDNFVPGLNNQNFNVLNYSLKEITLEKYRATLTRKKLQERDLFDLFLIKDSLKADIKLIVEKIKNSSLIKKDLTKLITDKLALLQNNKFFESKEKVENLSIVQYNKKEFKDFKEKINPKLIEICNKFLGK